MRSNFNSNKPLTRPRTIFEPLGFPDVKVLTRYVLNNFTQEPPLPPRRTDYGHSGIWYRVHPTGLRPSERRFRAPSTIVCGDNHKPSIDPPFEVEPSQLTYEAALDGVHPRAHLTNGKWAPRSLSPADISPWAAEMHPGEYHHKRVLR